MANLLNHDFTGELAVITGGGRGLGRTLAEAFAAAGATVAVIGRNADALADTADAIAAAGGQAFAFAADIGDAEQMVATAERIQQELGAPDILVNNAGINPWYRNAEKTPLDEFQAVMDVNLVAAFHCCLLFGRMMLDRGKGSIISISSVAGHVGLARSVAYNASKGGLEMMTKSLAIDWADRGVRVNTVAPGYFESDLTAGLQANEGLHNKVIERTPLQRFARQEEIVGACLFLASPAASYMTGQSIRVDGGYTAA